MSSSRRLSNGRSPLVRKQSQITSFFTPPKDLSRTPQGSNPTSSPDPSPSPSPSQQQPRQEKKPRLLITPSPASDTKSPTSTPGKTTAPGEEVIGRRIKVFWPLDKAWYKGRVLSFDAELGKHLVQYDDAEEEVLDLGQEKFDWVEDMENQKEKKPQKLRRLRRLSAAVEIDSKEMEVEDGSGIEDSTDDEDWVKNERKDAEEDDSEEEVELEDEDDEEVVISSRKSRSTSKGSSTGAKKRKVDVEKLNCKKKFKFDVVEAIASKSSLVKTGNSSNSIQIDNERKQTLDVTDCCLNADTGDRFGKREAEKFRFLREKRKDADGRCPGDENFDPRTLYLPQEFLRSLSGGQRQWWEFKSKHMDKVLFFKMGKFYELFEMDAHIGVKELDLQYMKGEQPHCGFPEKNFSMNLEKLARKGYRVLVVEQTETPEQLEFRRKEMGSKDKVVKREICAMVTKGTLIEGESLLANPNASYLLSIAELQDPGVQTKENVTIGLCLLDASTSKFMIGQFVDDPERHCLCSVLSELRPVEIIKPSKTLCPETERALKNYTRNPLVNDLLPFKEFWNAEKTIEEIKKYYGKGLHSLPDILTRLMNSGIDGSHALSALGGCLFYLKQALLDKSLLKCAKFEPLPFMNSGKTVSRSFMTLDASALENLEILENSSGGNTGTLFAHLDHCATAFGKRLLKGWLARPLYDVESIKERQDAIACFKGVGLASVLEFRKVLLKLPDMERLLARLFASCERNGRNAKNVILYEDAAKKQLQEFLTSLRGCKAMTEACSALYSALSCSHSSLIQRLLTPGKGLPDISEVLDHFENAFDWSEADRTGRIIPHKGGDTEYDAACKRVDEIESSLTRYLKEQRKLLGETMINYVTVGKDSYLIEVPESLRGAIPQEYELQSSKKGYFRYWTPEIKDFLSELSQAEAEKESKLKGILQRLIEQFSAQHANWRQLISVIAELDVVISLTIASDHYEGPTCRPTIKEQCHLDNTGPHLFAKALGHPILRSDFIGKGSFVSNDITIGGASHAKIILLTGPNMGGKSTLLRQVCLAVILAQLGADVPAEKFEFSIVDRVFVRMGARDHIMAGQSTFLMELTDTASVLSSATRDSLVALDELGRGTSTSDGQAIAASVLEYLVHTVQCRGLFSTHYHRLAVEYEKDKKVGLFHMACQVGKGTGGVEEVTFLYKLTPGSCPKSYGVNVARLAGLPSSVLQKASNKSRDFEINYGKRHPRNEEKILKTCEDEEITLIKEMLSFLGDWGLQADSQGTNMNLLYDIQQKARLLMMQY